MKILLEPEDIKKAIAAYVNQGNSDLRGEFTVLPEHIKWQIRLEEDCSASLEEVHFEGASVDVTAAKKEHSRHKMWLWQVRRSRTKVGPTGDVNG